jgi:putative FmdB family regulatory protein
MPTYEYRCEKGHTFERIQKMSDKPLTKCPVCGAKASRIISGGQGVIFKGSGFYITDYGKDGKGARKDPDGSSGPSTATDGKGDKKATDAAVKPDAKPDVKPAAAAPKPGKSDE